VGDWLSGQAQGSASTVGNGLAPSQPDMQKTAERLPTSTKLITILTITSPYLSTPQEFYLEKEEITLGHAGSSDILLDRDQTTSRHHAMLKRQGNQYYIYDLHSEQGVIVNRQKLTPDIGYALVDGDRIFICSYTLTLHLIPLQYDNESKKASAIP
jgi:pSer/pThr/pTyr-binding forkhead associated (FHA) protein